MQTTVDFSVIKQKIIKTDEVLQRYLNVQNQLKKVQLMYKQIKTKYQQSVNEVNLLKLDNERISYTLNVIQKRHDFLETENIEFKSQCGSLEAKYNQQIIQHQLNCRDLEEQLNSCKIELNLCSPKKTKSTKQQNARIKQLEKKCTELEMECKELSNTKIIQQKEIVKVTEVQNINEQNCGEINTLRYENDTLKNTLQLLNKQIEKQNLTLSGQHDVRTASKRDLKLLRDKLNGMQLEINVVVEENDKLKQKLNSRQSTKSVDVQTEGCDFSSNQEEQQEENEKLKSTILQLELELHRMKKDLDDGPAVEDVFAILNEMTIHSTLLSPLSENNDNELVDFLKHTEIEGVLPTLQISSILDEPLTHNFDKLNEFDNSFGISDAKPNMTQTDEMLSKLKDFGIQTEDVSSESKNIGIQTVFASNNLTDSCIQTEKSSIILQDSIIRTDLEKATLQLESRNKNYLCSSCKSTDNIVQMNLKDSGMQTEDTAIILKDSSIQTNLENINVCTENVMLQLKSHNIQDQCISCKLKDNSVQMEDLSSNLRDSSMQTEDTILKNSSMQTEDFSTNVKVINKHIENELPKMKNCIVQTEAISVALKHSSIQTDVISIKLKDSSMQTQDILTDLRDSSMQTDDASTILKNISVQTKEFLSLDIETDSGVELPLNHSKTEQLRQRKKFLNRRFIRRSGRITRKPKEDSILKTLLTLKKHNINFNISSETPVPWVAANCNCLKKLPESSPPSPRTNVKNPMEVSQKNSFIGKLSCITRNCIDQSFMLLNHHKDEDMLLGFFDVKHELGTPAVSHIECTDHNKVLDSSDTLLNTNQKNTTLTTDNVKKQTRTLFKRPMRINRKSSFVGSDVEIFEGIIDVTEDSVDRSEEYVENVVELQSHSAKVQKTPQKKSPNAKDFLEQDEPIAVRTRQRLTPKQSTPKSSQSNAHGLEEDRDRTLSSSGQALQSSKKLKTPANNNKILDPGTNKGNKTFAADKIRKRLRSLFETPAKRVCLNQKDPVESDIDISEDDLIVDEVTNLEDGVELSEERLTCSVSTTNNKILDPLGSFLNANEENKTCMTANGKKQMRTSFERPVEQLLARQNYPVDESVIESSEKNLIDITSAQIGVDCSKQCIIGGGVELNAVFKVPEMSQKLSAATVDCLEQDEPGAITTRKRIANIQLVPQNPQLNVNALEENKFTTLPFGRMLPHSNEVETPAVNHIDCTVKNKIVDPMDTLFNLIQVNNTFKTNKAKKHVRTTIKRPVKQVLLNRKGLARGSDVESSEEDLIGEVQSVDDVERCEERLTNGIKNLVAASQIDFTADNKIVAPLLNTKQNNKTIAIEKVKNQMRTSFKRPVRQVRRNKRRPVGVCIESVEENLIDEVKGAEGGVMKNKGCLIGGVKNAVAVGHVDYITDNKILGPLDTLLNTNQQNKTLLKVIVKKEMKTSFKRPVRRLRLNQICSVDGSDVKSSVEDFVNEVKDTEHGVERSDECLISGVAKTLELESVYKVPKMLHKNNVSAEICLEATTAITTRKRIAYTGLAPLNAQSNVHELEENADRTLSFGRALQSSSLNEDVAFVQGNLLVGNMEELSTDINDIDNYCPQSPEPEKNEVIFQLPKIIPLSKPEQLPGSKIDVLFEKLLIFSTEDVVLDEIVLHFLTQDVDYICGYILRRIALDTTIEADTKYTPPAPLMTDMQRVFLGFMSRLEKNNMSAFDSFLKLAERKLFMDCELKAITPIIRLYMAICRLRQDMAQVRRLCCDAFYFMGNLAVPLFFIVLTSWIEVFPKQSESNDDPLVKVLVQVVHLKDCNQPGYNLMTLRRLLNQYYEFPIERWNSDEMFNDLIADYLRNPGRLSDYPLLIFCKNHPSKWVYEKMEKTFKPFIEKIPTENFKATVIILVGNICSQLDKKSMYDCKILKEIRSWLLELHDESTSDLVKKSIHLSLKRLPKVKLSICTKKNCE